MKNICRVNCPSLFSLSLSRSLFLSFALFRSLSCLIKAILYVVSSLKDNDRRRSIVLLTINEMSVSFVMFLGGRGTRGGRSAANRSPVPPRWFTVRNVRANPIDRAPRSRSRDMV